MPIGVVGSYVLLNSSTVRQISREGIGVGKSLAVRGEIRDWWKCYPRTMRDG